MDDQSFDYDDTYDYYCDINISKLKPLFRNNNDDDINSSNDINVVKRKVGQHGRKKEYQLLSEEEYQKIKSQQRKDAYKRYYQKNKESRKEQIKKYYVPPRENRKLLIEKRELLNEKHSQHQNINMLKEKLDALEKLMIQDQEQAQIILQKANERRLMINELKQNLNSLV